jgi:hypothetical protein
MPNRRRPALPSTVSPPPAPKQSFRQRFVGLDAERARLVARLALMGEAAKQHPSHKRAMTLLNASFRRASLAQRAGILHAAEWLIDLLERMEPMI